MVAVGSGHYDFGDLIIISVSDCLINDVRKVGERWLKSLQATSMVLLQIMQKAIKTSVNFMVIVFEIRKGKGS